MLVRFDRDAVIAVKPSVAFSTMNGDEWVPSASFEQARRRGSSPVMALFGILMERRSVHHAVDTAASLVIPCSLGGIADANTLRHPACRRRYHEVVATVHARDRLRGMMIARRCDSSSQRLGGRPVLLHPDARRRKYSIFLENWSCAHLLAPSFGCRRSPLRSVTHGQPPDSYERNSIPDMLAAE